MSIELNLILILLLGVGSGLASGIARTTSVSASKVALRGASAAAVLVFTAIDVAYLVKDWNKNHPTINVINQLVEDLERDLEIIQKLDNFIIDILFPNDSNHYKLQ